LRYAVLPLVLLVVVGCGANPTLPTPTAADQPGKSDDPVTAVIEPLTGAVAVLEKVTDEASAKEARPQLETLFDEAEAGFSRLRDMKAEGKSPDDESSKRLGDVRAKLQAEYNRITTKHTSAFVVLQETRLFARLAESADDTATMRALSVYEAGKRWETRNDGGQLTQLADLAADLDDGKDGLRDPWGTPFQFKYVEDKRTGFTRLVVWTKNPQSGKKVGWPPELVDEKE
jgi:hypothetical protein